MKKTILFVLSLLLVNMAMAQMKVTGRVTASEDGSPIPYANILVKGVTGVGATTDLDGKYTFASISKDAVLVITYIGYTTKEIPVDGRAVINIALSADALNLEEIMIVAYGTSTKGTFTGAASVVKGDAIKDVPTLSFENALNGKVAGVQISSNSGQAGSTSSIRVRGIGSMNASNEPLYVIDGVPVVSGNVSNMGNYTSNNIMSTINPGDIESITILKDAAASSLYGSRAANGVIMITTKRGKMGRTNINFKASVGITPSFATDNYEAAGTQQQVEMYYENFWNADVYAYGKTPAVASATALAQLNKRFNKHGYTFTAPDNTVKSLTIGGNRAGTFYDWESQLLRTAVYQSYDLSVSGATDASNYYTSLSYTKEMGRSVINGFDRITGRVNLTQKVGKYVDFTTNINIAKSGKTGFNDSRSTGNNYFLQSRNLLWGLYWPTDYLTGADWTLRYGSYAYNAIYYNKEWENSSNTLRISANEAITVKLMPGLVFKSIFSYDNSQTLDHIYYSANHFTGSGVGGSVSEMSSNNNKLVSSSTLNYNKEIAKKHNIAVLVGWEAESNKFDFQRASGTSLPTSSLHTVATAGKLDATAYYSGNSMLSILSRAEYNYDNKYYVSGSYRRDGSSKLGPASRWGDFWSVAGSWRIDKEEFMKSIGYISSLKLRGSYGINGTLPSNNYGWRSLSTYTNKYMELPGGSVSSIADANLSWETSYSSNIALEFGLLDQRITGTVEYYNRDSKNLLQDVPISNVTGFYSTLQNIGEINNNGVEIDISGDIIRTKDLTWSVGITASTIKSTVTKLYSGEDGIAQPIIWYDPTGDDARAKFIYKEGQSTLALYGLEWAGVENATGKNLWFMNNTNTPTPTTIDLSGTKKIPAQIGGRATTYRYQDATEVIIGNVNPKLFGGFTTDLNWKGLSVSLGFTYKLGGNTYDGAGRDIADDGYYWERIMSQNQYDNRWTPEHMDATLPQRMATDMEDVNQVSSRHMHKAEYLRLKNMTIGYTIPKSIMNKVKISSARIYFNGSNLWTLAAYNVYDPEVNAYGSRGWEMPIGKTYTFGVEFNF